MKAIHVTAKGRPLGGILSQWWHFRLITRTTKAQMIRSGVSKPAWRAWSVRSLTPFTLPTVLDFWVFKFRYRHRRQIECE